MAIDYQTILTALKPVLPELVLLASLVIIAMIGLHTIEKLSIGFRKKWKDPLKAKFFQGIANTAFVSIIIIIMLSRIGVTDDVLKLFGLLVGGIVAFSSTSLIHNIVGGFVIQFTKPFRIGDVIEVRGHLGKVSDVDAVFTTIHTFNKTYVNVPNSVFLSGEALNYSEDGYRITIEVSLGYDISRIQAEDLLVKSAKLVKLDDIFVAINKFNDHAVSYQVNATSREPEAIPFIESRLRKMILDQFNLAKVPIMSPQIFLHKELKSMASSSRDSKRQLTIKQKEEAASVKKLVGDTFDSEQIVKKRKAKKKQAKKSAKEKK